jgi:gliding motility-associated protein GldM
MALPKEPRQKMINMMYLVLTALLALNVSSEILNAFKVVDNSLVSSNGIIDNTNKGIIGALDAASKEAETAEKAKIWKPKAEAALAISNKMAAYIDSLKINLKRESGLKIEDGVEVYKEDDLDAPTRLMSVNGQGPKLEAALAQFEKDIVGVLPPEDQKKLAKLPIDLSVPKSTNDGTKNTWTTAYFHMTPSVAALTMLSKFQNDVKRSGNIVADYCQQQIGKVVFTLDKFEPLVGQSSQYLLPGQPFELTAGLGSYSSANFPKVSVNGSNVPVDANGVALYKENAGGGGERTLNVVVSYKNPNTGKDESVNKVVKYTVGTPSGASIFLSKMNVMYTGVDNPVTISAGSIKAENMRVSFNKGTISKSGGDNYIAKLNGVGDGTITISGDGKTFSFPIRCKKLPPPTPQVGTLKSGNVSTAAFKAMGGLRAILEDSEFTGAPFTILGYTIGGFVNGEPREAQITGPSFAGNPIITSAKPGSTIGIYNIKAKGPGGEEYKLGDLVFNLK